MRCAGGSVNDGEMEQSFDPRQVSNANLIYILYLIGVAAQDVEALMALHADDVEWTNAYARIP